VILVLLVAWDERRNRLDHGRGYFDIAQSPLRGKMTVGLAFEAQRVEKIQAEMHDIPLRMTIIESRILRFERPSDYN
jgi:5-formyltetrahydrofolate cyclo-ligase